jgi:hypothetical protein
MANLDTPFGLKPVKHLTGAPWNGKVNVYYVPATDATALFKGDAVKSAGSADATGKFPTVAQVVAGDAVRGVIVGFGDNPYVMTHPDAPNRDYRPASTAMYVFVVDDPSVIFEVQEDSVGGALVAADVGLSADIVVAAGSTATGKSAMELDSSTKVATAATCKVLRVIDREDNELGTNAKWEVLIAEHEMNLATGV